jgi:hypothetical protein
VHDDGMEALLQRIDNAAGVVIGAPVNAGSVNALTQRFIERCVGFFFWPWGSHGGPRLRRKEKHRGAVLVSSSGAPALMNSLWFGVGALHSLKTVAEVLGTEVVDVVKIGMIAEPDVELPQRTLEASRKAGERLLQYAAARG